MLPAIGSVPPLSYGTHKSCDSLVQDRQVWSPKRIQFGMSVRTVIFKHLWGNYAEERRIKKSFTQVEVINGKVLLSVSGIECFAEYCVLFFRALSRVLNVRWWEMLEIS